MYFMRKHEEGKTTNRNRIEGMLKKYEGSTKNEKQSKENMIWWWMWRSTTEKGDNKNERYIEGNGIVEKKWKIVPAIWRTLYNNCHKGAQTGKAGHVEKHY